MRTRSFTLLATFALSACGGGTAGHLPPTSTKSTATATIRFVVPAAAKMATLRRRRLPSYVAPTAAALGVSAVPAGGTVPPDASPTNAFDISPTSPNCAAQADGSRACTFALALMPGTYTIVLSIWNAQPVVIGGSPSFAGARELSRSALVQTVVAGSNAIALALDGLVSHVGLTTALSTRPVSPTPQDIGVTAVAYDADGNTIIGSDPYLDLDGNPGTMRIDLQADDSQGRVQVAPVSGTTPGLSTMVHYAGGAAQSVTIEAVFSGGTNSGFVGRSGTLTLSFLPAAVDFPIGADSPVARWTVTPGSGAMWVAYHQPAGWRISRVALDGSLSSTYPLHGQPIRLLQGPDGRVWYPSADSTFIGAINLGTGVETDYPIAVPSYPVVVDAAFVAGQTLVVGVEASASSPLGTAFVIFDPVAGTFSAPIALRALGMTALVSAGPDIVVKYSGSGGLYWYDGSTGAIKVALRQSSGMWKRLAAAVSTGSLGPPSTNALALGIQGSYLLGELPAASYASGACFQSTPFFSCYVDVSTAGGALFAVTFISSDLSGTTVGDDEQSGFSRDVVLEHTDNIDYAYGGHAWMRYRVTSPNFSGPVDIGEGPAEPGDGSVWYFMSGTDPTGTHPVYRIGEFIP
jgi:hypothetical protein